jgi:hypothetical protein
MIDFISMNVLLIYNKKAVRVVTVCNTKDRVSNFSLSPRLDHF